MDGVIFIIGIGVVATLSITNVLLLRIAQALEALSTPDALKGDA